MVVQKIQKNYLQQKEINISKYRHLMVEKTKHDVCQNCIKRFYKSPRKNAIEIINFGDKKMTLLTKKESHSYSSLSYLQKKFREEHVNDVKYCKVSDYCHYTGKQRDVANSKCNLKYNSPKENVIFLFQNGSNYECFSL